MGNQFNSSFKCVFYTFKFELLLQKNKFLIFSAIVVLNALMGCYIMVAFNNLPWPQYSFFKGSMWWLVFIIAFSSSFFFSGIICTDYNKKKGLVIVPLISRNQFFTGKFLANNVYVIIIAIIQYSIMYLTAYFYYGPPMISTPLLNLFLVVLYLITLNALISFFSSFLPSPTYVIILILALYFFGFAMIESFILGINDSIEPLYSLGYLFNIVID